MTDVPRETSPPIEDPASAGTGPAGAARAAGPSAPPGAARVVFGKRLELAVAYAGWLADAGVTRGLIGPREVPRLWPRHLLNCAVVASLLPPDATVIDLGSGAGLPGIPLALVRPDLRIELLEPLGRRVSFLREVVSALRLENVTVVRGRAEDRAGAGVDIVTARAVAPLSRLADWALPLLRAGGSLIALKGATAEEEVTAAAAGLRARGAVHWGAELCGVGQLDPPTTVVRVVVGDLRSTGGARASGRGKKGRR